MPNEMQYAVSVKEDKKTFGERITSALAGTLIGGVIGSGLGALAGLAGRAIAQTAVATTDVAGLDQLVDAFEAAPINASAIAGGVVGGAMGAGNSFAERVRAGREQVSAERTV